jgi:hypothetical protein
MKPEIIAINGYFQVATICADTRAGCYLIDMNIPAEMELFIVCVQVGAHQQ